MDKSAAEKALSLAASFKTDAAEIFFRSSSSVSLEVKDQAIDAFDRARDRGLGLRVLKNGRMGFAFTTDMSIRSIEKLVADAVSNAVNTEPDPYYSLPPKFETYAAPAIFDAEFSSLSDTEKIARVMAMEREAFGVDPRIKRVRKASAAFSDMETLIMNSNGVELSYRSTACSAGIEVVAEEKQESQAGSEFDVSRFYRRLEIEEVGRKAARKALDLLGAKHIESQKAPVLLESTVAQEFLGLMAGGFSAESVQKKRSLFMGKLGTQVASSAVTVVDDGLLEGGLGAAPADDESVPMRKKIVIDKGQLALFLYNTYTANKDRTVSTGNGIRGGFKSSPHAGITNLFIAPGAKSFAELLQSVDRGLLVTEVMGMHTANAISGDFSVGATGFWIEKGERVFPVREITIAGNILDFMSQVEEVGGDVRFSGRLGSPSLLVRDISIAGK